MKSPKATCSLYLDARRAKGNNKFPVKLRLYFNNQTKLYYTGEDFSETDFERSYLNQKPRDQHKEYKIKLSEIEGKAQKIINALEPFSFEQFEKKMFRLTSNRDNVFFHYENYINTLNKEERLGTANNYLLSMKSIKSFISDKRNTNASKFSFQQITPEFLRKYEVWMLENGRSRTTVGIYLRPLRAIFNNAMSDGDIPGEIYPFGKKKFQIPAGRNIKKALRMEELRTLFYFPLPANSIMAKARAFWFFSYCCNGMNTKDIAELKYKDIYGDRIVFTRSKTKNTTRSNSKPITVFVTDFVKDVIAKYGNKPMGGETYVFPVVSEKMSGTDKRRAIQNFTRFINGQIKKIAKEAELNTNMSTNWARHSYTSTAIRNGAAMEYIQESLGHQSLATTQNYWAGFEDDAKKGIAEKLLHF